MAMAAAKKGKKAKAIGTVFDDVENYDDAMAKALRGEHLKRDGDGKYIGAPADVDSPQKLARNRRNADRQVEKGVFNADWYTRARNAATETSGDSPDMHAWFSLSCVSTMASNFSVKTSCLAPGLSREMLPERIPQTLMVAMT
jgi:ABC-type Zn uptake system ZnuABC Zn-binding protein ZnuA